MQCQKCKKDFPEAEIDESHDVPKYLFWYDEEQKHHADSMGRHHLCKKCHDIYERKIMGIIVRTLSKDELFKLQKLIKSFATRYFNGS